MADALSYSRQTVVERVSPEAQTVVSLDTLILAILEGHGEIYIFISRNVIPVVSTKGQSAMKYYTYIMILIRSVISIGAGVFQE